MLYSNLYGAFLFSSPYVPPGGRGGSSLPSQSTQGMVIVVLPTLVRGCWMYVIAEALLPAAGSIPAGG